MAQDGERLGADFLRFLERADGRQVAGDASGEDAMGLAGVTGIPSAPLVINPAPVSIAHGACTITKSILVRSTHTS